MFVRVTSYVLYFILFFHCDLHNPSIISPIHTMIHSFLYFLFIQVLFSLHHDIDRNPMFNLHVYKETVLLSLFLHFTYQSLQIIDFFLPFALIPILFKSFYFNDNAHWVLFHGMLLSIIHSQPMIILLLLECFLHRLNYLQQSSILHSWTDSCHYPTLTAATINIWSTIVFVPHSNTPNICKLSQATHSRYNSDYFPITIHSSHISNTSSIPQILQLSLVFQ